jgi:hypothetical protein
MGGEGREVGVVAGVTKTVGKSKLIVKHNGKIIFHCIVDY